MTTPALPPEDLQHILTYLSLPSSPTLPLPPLQFLEKYLPLLPYSSLRSFSSLTTPRQRSSLPIIKSRRLLHASSIPTPRHLRAPAGRRRWPLLWERMGGSSLALLGGGGDDELDEEEEWVDKGFMGGVEGVLGVKKLGGFLRGLEEERELEGVRDARRVERRLDDVGEEFDEESDEEEQGRGQGRRVVGGMEGVDQEEVERAFEKRLMELFVDGLDTISYDEVDFTEPPGGDPIAVQDDHDRYFDDEEPTETPITPQTSDDDRNSAEPSSKGDNTSDLESVSSELSTQNGQGEYDY